MCIKIYEATIGENLLWQGELNNIYDPFAVAVPGYQIVISVILQGSTCKFHGFARNREKRKIYIHVPAKIFFLMVFIYARTYSR